VLLVKDYNGENLQSLALSELRQMEVIEISEGKRLGYICDIVFDDELKKIDGFIIPPQSGVFSLFKKKDEVFIKWDQICVIGIDIILINMENKKSNDVQINNIKLQEDNS
jgi:YlmC/YmxH family sporulation protein